jgi:Tol biopolymer transport system component
MFAASQNRPLGNGSILVVRGSELVVVDGETGEVTTLVAEGAVSAVSRSLGGGWVSFWSGSGGDKWLEVMRSDGTGRRPVAEDVQPRPEGKDGLNLWSNDERFLAADVVAAGIRRILIVEVASGNGWLIGPESGAMAPLWSPDGEWVAFRQSNVDGPATLAVMRRDGSEVREISGALGGRDVSGANSWSADGVWVYFDAGGHIFRANVPGGYSEQLTLEGTNAAPALSPDGQLVTYTYWLRGPSQPPDLYVMNVDGGEPRLLLERAINNGWSRKGDHVLAERHRDGQAAELVTISIEQGSVRILLTFDGPCLMPCFGGPSWGQPRP